MPGSGIQDGPRHINLYVHAIRYDDCSGGPTLGQIGQAIQGMNQAFNPHDIWFNLVCIDDVCSSLAHENNCMIPSYYSTFSNTKGINLYLTVGNNDTSCTMTGQTQSPLPSKNCWAAWYSHIPTHEVGHCLGLDHTFLPGECVTRDSSSPHYNCALAGDGFCDTPADNENYAAVNGDCTWNYDLAQQWGIVDACESRVYETDPSLVMSYSGCGYRFSNQQALRMRDYAHSGSAGPPADPYQYKAFYISSPTVWDAPQKFNVDVIVASTLDVLGTTVEMAPGKKIILLDGSELLVNDSKITVANLAVCSPSGNGVMWQGIEVHAASAATFINIENGSVIEKAYRGLYLATPSESGAWINIRDSHFRNNYNSIYFIKSTSSTPALKIRNTSFEVDPDYPLSTYSRQIYLSNFNLLATSGIHFKNTKDILATKAGGVYSYNGYVNISGGTQEGFEKGIEGISFANMQPVLVRNFASAKSANHISVSNRRGNLFKGLNITTGDRPNLSGAGNNFGLKLEKSQLSTIRDNDFYDADPTPNKLSRTGIIVDRNGAERLIVGVNNDFSNMPQAISTSYENSGVELLCNYNSGNTKDFNCVQIKDRQGVLSAQAGNTFSNPNGFFSFTNINSAFKVEYFYGISTAEFPASVSPTVNRIPTQLTGCLYSAPPQITDIGEAEGEYADITQQLNGLYPLIGTNLPNESEIQGQIQHLEVQLADVYSQAFALILAPEEGSVDDSLLVVWLQRVNSFESISQIAYVHLQNREYSAAWTLYNNIPILFNLDSIQQQEWEQMGWLFNFMVPVFSQGRWEGDLTSGEVQNLETFADTSTTGAGLMARHILEFFYTDQPESLKGNKEIYSSKNDGVSNSEMPGISWRITPVPASNELTIRLYDFDPKANYSGVLSNFHGIRMQEWMLRNAQTRLELQKIPSGVYFMQLFRDERLLGTQKLIVH